MPAVPALHAAAFCRPAGDVIQQRAATDFFDPTRSLADPDIERLAELATRAPSAYNLQNWRFHAVRTPEMKAQLRAAAYGQAKVEEAAVTFVVSGLLPDGEELADRLLPSIEAGIMTSATADAWVAQARASFVDGEKARDEAIRSATLLAATLMFAAEGAGFSTAPMVGFDRDSVRRLLRSSDQELPVFLLAIGAAMPGKAPQKPRRPLSEVLLLL